jgi:peptidoglycan/LPS O-acetylase OafA/YrhL
MTLPEPSHRAYRPDIDGLRAIAVLLVLIFHFHLVPEVEGGFTGVDVFFVISGFLITSIIRASLGKSAFDLRGFYVARIRRLGPALVATLAATAIAGCLILFPADLHELTNQILSAQAYVANVYFWRNVNYFGLSSDNVFLLHTWSLAVEEQFYLFYPLLLIMLARLRQRRFWIVIALLALASFALNVAMVRTRPEADFYLLPTRAWELLIGALTTQFGRFVRNHWLLQASGGLGLALIMAGAAAYRPSLSFPGFFALIPTLGAALLLGSGAAAPMLAHRVLSAQPLRYIGKISYPLYLVHWPVIVFCSFATGGPSAWPIRLAMFIGSIAAASGLYHLVERPIRERRLFGATAPLLSAYGGALAVSIGMFALMSASHGWPQRFSPETLRLAAFEEDKTAPFSECEFAGKKPTAFEEPCLIGEPGAAPRWLVVGDSHAWASRDAFNQWLKAEGAAGVFIFRHACPPINGIHLLGDNGQCHEFNDKVMAFADAHPSLRSVLLVSTWRQAPEQRVSTDEHVQLDKAAALELFRARFSATVERLHDMGRRVYVWEPVPGARANVPAALARANIEGKAADIEMSRADYLREFAFFFDDLKADAPQDVLCSTGKCVAQIGANPVYFDNSHLTRSSAGLIAAMLERGPKPVADH